MQDMTPDEYCQNKFHISFDEYVKRAVAQELIFYAIAQNENIIIKYSIFITYHHTVLYITIKNKR